MHADFSPNDFEPPLHYPSSCTALCYIFIDGADCGVVTYISIRFLLKDIFYAPVAPGGSVGNHETF